MQTSNYFGATLQKGGKTLEGFEGFHFPPVTSHLYKQPFSKWSSPKDVQELLGHSDVNTTMNVYAHSTKRDAKRKSVRLLDKV